MRWARFLIFGIPAVVFGIAGWAAWQSRQAHAPRGDQRTVVMPGALPNLHPFLPADEAERQVLDLLHEPLVRLGSNGRLTPGLADEWRWQVSASCWFASEPDAEQAAARVQALSGNQWLTWQLDETTVAGRCVTMRFADAEGTGAEAAIASIRDLQPLRLTLVEIRPQAMGTQSLAEFVKQHPDLVPRAWPDEEGGGEVATTVSALQLQERLAAWQNERREPVMRVRAIREVMALIEPALEFRLRPGRSWTDGTAIAAEDVRATWQWYRRQPWAGASGAKFEWVRAIEAAGTEAVRVIYQKPHGAGLAAWVDFPILSAKWLASIGDGPASNAPGAGAYRILERSSQVLLLEKVAERAADEAPKQLQFLPSWSELQTRLALAAKAGDVWWPNKMNTALLQAEGAFSYFAAAPRNRLLVLWNTRSGPMADVRVREALAMATDREALVQELLQGNGRLIEGYFPPGVWYNPPGAPKHRHNRPEAERKLAEAGWWRDVNGMAKKGARPLRVELLITSGNIAREMLARALAEQWREIGVEVEVEAVNGSELVRERLRPGAFDAVLLGLDYELSWDQSELWHSDPEKGVLNFSGVADPQLDLLLDALAGEHEVSQVPARAGAVAARLRELSPMLPLFSDSQQMALRPARFPGHPLKERARGLSLRDVLLPAAPAATDLPKLEMIIPDE